MFVAGYRSVSLKNGYSKPLWLASLLVHFVVMKYRLYCIKLFSVFISLTGYRSVSLKNGYSEPLELASLLVHIEMRNPKVIALILNFIGLWFPKKPIQSLQFCRLENENHFSSRQTVNLVYCPCRKNTNLFCSFVLSILVGKWRLWHLHLHTRVAWAVGCSDTTDGEPWVRGRQRPSRSC